MTVEKIEQFEELVSSLVGKNKKIVAKEISRLTAPGENNCSIVLKVDVSVENEDGDTEEINAVAKIMPSNKFTRFAFESGFKNETAFYDIIVPTLKNFQEEQGVHKVSDIFPKVYTSRVSLNKTNEDVDDDAVLLLENLIVSGYKNVNRLVGFDLETIKSILKDLAAFHAIPLALKRTKPEIYEKNIRPYLTGMPPPPERGDRENGDGPTPPDKIVLDILEDYDEFLPILPLLQKNLGKFQPPQSDPDRLFSTISHNDMWVNNIMTKFEEQKPLKIKFVDFQACTHASLAKDLIFLLLTSVQEPILKENFDDLLKIYYDHFIENLNQLQCDIAPFTYQAFLDELKYTAKDELGHAIGMTCFVVLAKIGGMFGDGEGDSHPPNFKKEDLTPQAIQRVIFSIRECNKRGWIF